MDRFAKQSVLFRRAYCNQAVCAPSRNALLTGARPDSVGIYDLGTNFRVATPDAVTLPQFFLQNGYRTEALGKIFHVGHGNHEDPRSWSVPHYPQKSVAYVLPESRANEGLTREEALFSNQNANRLPRGAAYESADVPDNAYPDGRLAEEAIRSLQKAKGDPQTTFFIAVGFLKPHLPFCAPKKYWDMYDRKAFKIPSRRSAPEGAPRYAPTTWGEVRQYKDIPNSGPMDDEKGLALIHGYYAATSYVDAQIGKVLSEVERLGLSKNTIVVLWGDHGWHLGDNGMWSKHSNYEQANRIPLMISGPGITKGRKSDALVESVDIYPTLVELAGLPKPQVPQGLDGTSMVPVLKSRRSKGKEAVFHVYPRHRPPDGAILGRAVRTDRYRLVEWKKPGAPSGTAELELYDYKTDPGETKNLALEHPQIAAKLHALIKARPEAKPQVSGRLPLDRGALFNRKDSDKNGKLTREEFLKDQPDPREAPNRFSRFDANKDGVLSREEFIHQGKLP